MFRSERYSRPWTLTGPTPPRRIEGPRIVLRGWEPADARLFEPALRANRAHIGAWIPPVWDEPSELDVLGDQFRCQGSPLLLIGGDEQLEQPVDHLVLPPHVHSPPER